MANSIYSKDGIRYPIFSCDSCSKPIKNVELAVVTFPDFSGDYASCGIYHKGQCDPGNNVHPNSEELTCYIQQLAWNYDVGKKEVHGSKSRLIVEMPKADGFFIRISQPPWD